jgi:hypothetical protein
MADSSTVYLSCVQYLINALKLKWSLNIPIYEGQYEIEENNELGKYLEL